LFSAGSIWRRRPLDPRAVAPYLAMSLLYKRANPLWTFLIRHRLVASAWRPLVEATRRRHLVFRRRLAMREVSAAPASRQRETLALLPGACRAVTPAAGGGSRRARRSRTPSRRRSPSRRGRRGRRGGQREG